MIDSTGMSGTSRKAMGSVDGVGGRGARGSFNQDSSDLFRQVICQKYLVPRLLKRLD